MEEGPYTANIFHKHHVWKQLESVRASFHDALTLVSDAVENYLETKDIGDPFAFCARGGDGEGAGEAGGR